MKMSSKSSKKNKKGTKVAGISYKPSDSYTAEQCQFLIDKQKSGWDGYTAILKEVWSQENKNPEFEFNPTESEFYALLSASATSKPKEQSAEKKNKNKSFSTESAKSKPKEKSVEKKKKTDVIDISDENDDDHPVFFIE